MSLRGNAAVVIWNDVAVESRAAFLAWHNHEHIPERVLISGFQRGRRCRATAAGPEFLTLYEVADLSVLNGGEYLERLNSPSPRTRRILPKFRNTARSLCRVEMSVGAGIGEYLCAVRLPDELRQDCEALRRFRASTRHLVGNSTELIGAHLLARDIKASRMEMAEKKLRTESVAMPATILLIEGTAEGIVAAAATELCNELDRLRLVSMNDALTGTYRHEICLTAAECDPPGLALSPN